MHSKPPWSSDRGTACPPTRAWLVSTGRHKAIDGLRRRSRANVPLDDVAERLVSTASDSVEQDVEDVQDDRLRLIFTCCPRRRRWGCWR